MGCDADHCYLQAGRVHANNLQQHGWQLRNFNWQPRGMQVVPAAEAAAAAIAAAPNSSSIVTLQALLCTLQLIPCSSVAFKLTKAQSTAAAVMIMQYMLGSIQYEVHCMP